MWVDILPLAGLSGVNRDGKQRDGPRYLPKQVHRLSICRKLLGSEDENGNGILESFEDVGLDGLANEDEPCYDSIDNTDPAVMISIMKTKMIIPK